MPNYRRWREGRIFFFTVVTGDRKRFLCASDARTCLRSAIMECQHRWPFKINAIVILPDHLHAIWTMPPADNNYSLRWAWIKRQFTVVWGKANRGSACQMQPKWQRRRNLFQARFWEHTIRDEEDYGNHIDYIHFNPVKHGYVCRPAEWPYSTFQKFVRSGWYPADWGDGDSQRISQLDSMSKSVGE